jgi:hypothetical protein
VVLKRLFVISPSVFQTAKYVRESYDALVDVFECIENFLRRLKIYTEIPPTPAMTETLVKIMIELLSVLALATKQINQGRFSRCILPKKKNYPGLKLLQRDMQRNCSEKETLRRCCRGSIGSPWRSLGRRLRRHSMSSMVWSITWRR